MFAIHNVAPSLPHFLVVDVPIALVGTDRESEHFVGASKLLGLDPRGYRLVRDPNDTQVATATQGFLRSQSRVEVIDGPGLVFDVLERRQNRPQARRVKLLVYERLLD